MNKSLSTVLIACSIVCSYAHAHEMPASVKSNIQNLIEGLSIDDMLTILSAAKLKALISKPEIAGKLYSLENEMDEACQEAYAAIILTQDQHYDRFSFELQFKQQMIFALYTLLYTKVAEMVKKQGIMQHHITLANQLTPEELKKILAE